jgi:catechol 2,3-dioxygenase-like lactoylglutathione lyase family enzyme
VSDTPALDHTIVHSTDRARSAHFLADVLGLPVDPPAGPFLPVRLGNGVTLDFAEQPAPPTVQHYAFRVSEARFDAAFTRIRDTGTPYWADPHRTRPGEINRRNGGRGVYFTDPDGHVMELLTAP